MRYLYETQGTCSTEIELELDGDVIKDVKFTGGCNGNLQGISRLVVGRTVDEVERDLSGIRCGFRPTSCPDQLARAVRAAYEAERQQ